MKFERERFLERQRREMEQPGATPQEVEVPILEALKARNEVADQLPQDQPARFHFAPSALDVLLGTPPGALPQAITFRAFGASIPERCLAFAYKLAGRHTLLAA